MKVYVCYTELEDGGYNIVQHVFFYREDADKWVAERHYTEDFRHYKEMKIE